MSKKGIYHEDERKEVNALGQQAEFDVVNKKEIDRLQCTLDIDKLEHIETIPKDYKNEFRIKRT